MLYATITGSAPCSCAAAVKASVASAMGPLQLPNQRAIGCWPISVRIVSARSSALFSSTQVRTVESGAV